MVEKLEPCPFCGGPAEIVHIDEGENAGGSCVACTSCLACSNIEFEFKENFVSNWNRRTPPASPSVVADDVAKLREALECIISECQVPIDQYEKNGPTWTGKSGQEYEDTSYVLEKMVELQDLARAALADGEKSNG